MDGVSGLESGAQAVFPNVTVQRCIVHILRNSLKYIPNKERAGFCKDIKRVYGALKQRVLSMNLRRNGANILVP